MADYRTAITPLLEREGGYVHHPSDKGGETYRGITRRDWPRWAGWRIVDAVKAKLRMTSPPLAHAGRRRIDALLMGMPEMEAEVRDFYKPRYWDPLGLDAEPSQRIAEKVFDIAVNQGVGAAKAHLAVAKAGGEKLLGTERKRTDG